MQNEKIMKFEFNQQEVDFELNHENVIVNATQMAKIFGKNMANFTRSDETKYFISVCLKNANKHYLKIETEEDLIFSKQKSGTWMHRVLALKFSAWLNPQFELFVYSTIEQFLFGRLKQLEESLKISAKRKNRIDELKNELSNDDRFSELERIELEELQAAYNRGKENRNQLDIFRENYLKS